MTLSVLQQYSEITDARAEMRRERLSVLPPMWVCGAMRRIGLARLIPGDFVKSWDVWKTTQFLRCHIRTDDPVVDFGAYKSEILPILHRSGFRNLHGIDLNPRIRGGLYSESIQYCQGDFFSTPYDDDSFAAVTSISAIEHGHDVARLLSEVHRVLRLGGYLICSTDYWPDKIDTTGISVLGMSWTIFSKSEILDIVSSGRQVGLELVGDANFDACDQVITHAGRRYTFAWFVLRKVR